MLRVQGVRTKCVVAYPEEAGRLCSLFMTAGSLTLYFDARLNAPVLYSGSHAFHTFAMSTERCAKSLTRPRIIRNLKLLAERLALDDDLPFSSHSWLLLLFRGSAHDIPSILLYPILFIWDDLLFT